MDGAVGNPHELPRSTPQRDSVLASIKAFDTHTLRPVRPQVWGFRPQAKWCMECQQPKTMCSCATLTDTVPLDFPEPPSGIKERELMIRVFFADGTHKMVVTPPRTPAKELIEKVQRKRRAAEPLMKIGQVYLVDAWGYTQALKENDLPCEMLLKALQEQGTHEPKLVLDDDTPRASYLRQTRRHGSIARESMLREQRSLTTMDAVKEAVEVSSVQPMEGRKMEVVRVFEGNEGTYKTVKITSATTAAELLGVMGRKGAVSQQELPFWGLFLSSPNGVLCRMMSGDLALQALHNAEPGSRVLFRKLERTNYVPCPQCDLPRVAPHVGTPLSDKRLQGELADAISMPVPPPLEVSVASNAIKGSEEGLPQEEGSKDDKGDKELKRKEEDDKELKGKEEEDKELKGKEEEDKELKGKEEEDKELKGKEEEDKELKGKEEEDKELKGKEEEDKELKRKDDDDKELKRKEEENPPVEHKDTTVIPVSVVRKGDVWRRSRASQHPWKKRCAVLREDASLSFIKDTEESRKSLVVRAVLMCELAIYGREHCFEVITDNGHPYPLAVASEEERSAWTRAIKKTMVAAKVQPYPLPSLEGFLHKRGHKGKVLKWKRRWFVLQGSSLQSYKDPQERGHLGPYRELDITGCRLTALTEAGQPDPLLAVYHRPNCIEITLLGVAGNEKFVVFAETDRERRRWFSKIEASMGVQHTGRNSILAPIPVATEQLDSGKLPSLPCPGCSKKVTSPFLLWMERGWHYECFVCHICHARLHDAQRVYEKKGVPLCCKCR